MRPLLPLGSNTCCNCGLARNCNNEGSAQYHDRHLQLLRSVPLGSIPFIA